MKQTATVEQDDDGMWLVWIEHDTGGDIFKTFTFCPSNREAWRLADKINNETINRQESVTNWLTSKQLLK